MEPGIYKFPENFKWGSATSAHQIEGDNHNDWSEWEKSPERLAQLKKEGREPGDFISGAACGGYDRYNSDLDIAKDLGQNIYRFSIEWSRIEPEEGKFDFNAIQHYKDVVKATRDRGMEPMITLWHFTSPVWFAKDGGWADKRAPERFIRFIKVVVDNFLDQKVGYWLTFNEATTVYASFSYMKGLWPPQEKSLFRFFLVRRNILRAHTLTYQYIKKAFGGQGKWTETGPRHTSHNVMVGFAESLVYVPHTKGKFGSWLRRRYKNFRNFYFLNKSAPYCDFIGLNYYHMDRRPHFAQKDEVIPPQDVNQEMGWELYPPGIYGCLMDLKKYRKPVFITENGIADGPDTKRAQFIKDHLYWVWKAIQDGADVRGYLYWSLLDNFEWSRGFSPRFGLVEVDYKSLERRLRPSAREYEKICRSNSLEL